MELLATRDTFGDEATLSTLRVKWGRLGWDGRKWTSRMTLGVPLDFGHVLEDQDRGLDVLIPSTLARKVRKETAIPVGRYRVLHTHSPKYGKEVMQLLSVPGFQGIRIHPGNDESDTEGCPLPGLYRGTGFTVVRSTPAVEWLSDRVRECTARKEEVFWVVDRDPVAWERARATLPHLAGL